jgi:hypothetical protein
MDVIIKKFSKIKKSDIPILLKVLEAELKGRVDPEIILSWGPMQSKERAVDIERYFRLLLQDGVSEVTLQKAVRKIFARKYWLAIRKFLFSLFFVACGALSWRWWQFSQLPRVYSIGNEIAVNLSDGKTRNYSFQDGSDALIETSFKWDSINVLEDNFITWVIGKSPTGTVSSQDFIHSKDSLERYDAIFKDMEGTDFLKPYGSAVRRKIYNVLQMDSLRSPLRIVAKSAPSSKVAAYELPFYFYQPPSASGLNEALFVSVDCQDGIHNMRYVLGQDGTIQKADPVILAGGVVIKGPLSWSKPTHNIVPELHFTDGKSFYRYRRSDAVIAEKVNK